MFVLYIDCKRTIISRLNPRSCILNSSNINYGLFPRRFLFNLVGFCRQGVLDVRTLHQRFIARLSREKSDGLRDSNGVLVGLDQSDVTGNSDFVGDDDLMGNSDVIGDGHLMGGSDVMGDDAVGYSNILDYYFVGSNDIVDDNDVMVDDDAVGDIVLVDVDVLGDIDMIGEGNDVMKNNDVIGGGEEEFSFLLSGFDEDTLGGMRAPPFLLPMALVGENHVKVRKRNF